MVGLREMFTVAGLGVMEKFWERNGEEGRWREEAEALGALDNEEQGRMRRCRFLTLWSSKIWKVSQRVCKVTAAASTDD